MPNSREQNLVITSLTAKAACPDSAQSKPLPHSFRAVIDHAASPIRCLCSLYRYLADASCGIGLCLHLAPQRLQLPLQPAMQRAKTLQTQCGKVRIKRPWIPRPCRHNAVRSESRGLAYNPLQVHSAGAARVPLQLVRPDPLGVQVQRPLSLLPACPARTSHFCD